ncbi:hypothetical protein M231_07990 [Tremella mesenterica]|uniref:Uncharacterized protein n=1 Tax=Tremella mesenterica TaxID=5217 RepID=A0A4Q1B7U0_TREME|nr:hypothetical protein M231_07990 [Tremella mesenterica]
MPRSPTYSRSRTHSPVDERSPSRGESTCPFLIRIFVTKGRHTPLVDFDEGKFPLRDEFPVYGWKHSTPTSLIQTLLPCFPPLYRSPLARYAFRHVYVDASQRGLYRSRDLVAFTGRDLMTSLDLPKSGKMDMELDEAPRGGKVEEKTLEDYGFITGDLLSVFLFVPEPKVPVGQRFAPGTGPNVPSVGWGERDKNGSWTKGVPSLSIRGRGKDLVPETIPPGNWRGGAPGSGGERNGHRRSEVKGRSRSISPTREGRRESWSRR